MKRRKSSAEQRSKYNKTYRLNHPWANTLGYIKHRIFWRKGMSKCYEGIKNYLTLSDLKTLWFRDKAYLMKKPSIDRIDSFGHYELSNCRYIEFLENCRQKNKAKRKKYCINGHEYTDKNTITTSRSRRCRACRIDSSKRLRERKRLMKEGKDIPLEYQVKPNYPSAAIKREGRG